MGKETTTATKPVKIYYFLPRLALFFNKRDSTITFNKEQWFQFLAASKTTAALMRQKDKTHQLIFKIHPIVTPEIIGNNPDIKKAWSTRKSLSKTPESNTMLAQFLYRQSTPLPETPGGKFQHYDACLPGIPSIDYTQAFYLENGDNCTEAATDNATEIAAEIFKETDATKFTDAPEPISAVLLSSRDLSNFLTPPQRTEESKTDDDPEANSGEGSAAAGGDTRAGAMSATPQTPSAIKSDVMGAIDEYIESTKARLEGSSGMIRFFRGYVHGQPGITRANNVKGSLTDKNDEQIIATLRETLALDDKRCIAREGLFSLNTALRGVLYRHSTYTPPSLPSTPSSR